MEHPDELLPELALGTLEAPERAQVEAHVRSCSLCAEALADHARALAALAAALPQARPGAAAERAVLARVEGPARFEPLTAAVAELLDLSREAARAVFALACEAEGWEPGPAPGISLRPLPAGPRLAGSATNLFRLAPGALFPLHGHDGDETVLVLQGGFTDDQNGREFIRGDRAFEPMERQHSLTVMPDLECIAVVIHTPPKRAGQERA